MGLLDDLKHKVEALGEKAREGLDAAVDKAGDVVDDVKSRVGQDDRSEQAPLGESDDVSSDAAEDAGTLNPTDVPDEEDTDDDAADLDAADESDSADEPADEPMDEAAEDVQDVGTVGTVGTDADAVSSGDLDAEQASDPVSGPDGDAGEGTPTPTEVFAVEDADPAAEDEPVESDVDPYDEPLTEPIGDSIDAAALARAVEETSDDDTARG